MTTNFPYSADSYTTKTNGVDIVYAAHVNNLQDAVVALETEVLRTYPPDRKPASPSAYDDEFEVGSLNAAWTASNCVTGTVSLLATDPANGVYDLSTYPGMLTLQPARDDDGSTGLGAAAMVTKTITLGTNCKIIAKLNSSYPTDDYVSAGLLLSGPNGFSDDNFIYSTHLLYAGQGQVNIAATPVSIMGIGLGPYLMILKNGNYYSAWISMPNGVFSPLVNASSTPDLYQFEIAGTMNRLTLFSYWYPPSTEVNMVAPMTVFDFVRYYPNNTPLINA